MKTHDVGPIAKELRPSRVVMIDAELLGRLVCYSEGYIIDFDNYVFETGDEGDEAAIKPIAADIREARRLLSDAAGSNPTNQPN